MSNPTVSLLFPKRWPISTIFLLLLMLLMSKKMHTLFVPPSYRPLYCIRQCHHTTFVTPIVPPSPNAISLYFSLLLRKKLSHCPTFPTFPKRFTFPILPTLLTAIPRSPSSLTTENCQLSTDNCQLMFFVFLCLNNQPLMFFRLKNHQLITDN